MVQVHSVKKVIFNLRQNNRDRKIYIYVESKLKRLIYKSQREHLGIIKEKNVQP